MSHVHIILKQVFEVDFRGSEADGVQLQNKISSLCNGPLTTLLNEVLDTYAPLDDHLVIDKLEIDAGSVTLENVEEELIVKLKTALQEALQKKLDAVYQMSHYHDNSFEGIVVTPDSMSLLKALVSFLEHGSLTWNYKLPEHQTFEQALLTHLQSEPAWWPRFADEVRGVITSHANARTRLVNQFSDPFKLELLSWISVSAHSMLMTVISMWRRSSVSTKAMATFERAVWSVILQELAIDRPSLLIQTVEHAISRIDPNADKDVALQIAHQVAELWPEARVELALQQRERKLYAPVLTVHKLYKEVQHGIFVGNAGIVLLHPFLPAFFREVGVVNDDEMADSSRAIALLHFLATAEMNVQEYDAPLLKILCGIEIEDPVDVIADVTGNDIAECNSLLNAVVKHWSVLRNTSVDGLRESFLKRSGKLTEQQDGAWLLHVESQTYDVLLDHLPWGIGMIQLPWMKYMCRVEWNP